MSQPEEPQTQCSLVDRVLHDRRYRMLDLERYLCALLNAIADVKDRKLLTLAQFQDILAEAFVKPAVTVERPWTRECWNDHDETTFQGCRMTLIRQICDLRDSETIFESLRSSGFEDSWLRDGMVLRGGFWRNFELPDFLKAGESGTLAAAIRSCEAESPTIDRWSLFDAERGVRIADPLNVEAPNFEFVGVSWGAFNEFLQNAQSEETSPPTVDGEDHGGWY